MKVERCWGRKPISDLIEMRGKSDQQDHHWNDDAGTWENAEDWKCPSSDAGDHVPRGTKIHWLSAELVWATDTTFVAML